MDAVPLVARVADHPWRDSNAYPLASQTYTRRQVADHPWRDSNIQMRSTPSSTSTLPITPGGIATIRDPPPRRGRPVVADHPWRDSADPLAQSVALSLIILEIVASRSNGGAPRSYR